MSFKVGAGTGRVAAARAPSLGRRVMLAGAALAASGRAWGQEPTKVRIGLSSNSLPAAGARIAKEMGLFERHGIDAAITALDSANTATLALISGSIDFATSTGADVVVARSRGQDIVAVSSIVNGLTAVLMLAKPVADRLGGVPADPAQRLKAVNDLTIATPSATSPFTLALKASAEAVGAKVRFVYIDQPAMFAALKAGAVQGFLAASPYYAAPLLDGSGVMWLNGPKGEFPSRFTPANAVTLNALRAFVDARPDLMRRAASVFADLSDAARTRTGAVKAAIARLFPSIEERTLDVLYDTDLAGFRAKPLDAGDMAREIAFVQASGIPAPDIGRLDPASLMFRP